MSYDRDLVSACIFEHLNNYFGKFPIFDSKKTFNMEGLGLDHHLHGNTKSDCNVSITVWVLLQHN